MTQEIQWGPAIAVDGKRPGMIVDGEPIKLFVSYALGGDRETVAKQQISWPHIEAIALPADHPHYRQTEAAPIDWSGELEAVHEDGTVSTISPCTVAECKDIHYGGIAGYGHRDVHQGGWRKDGSPMGTHNRWRIRNVPQPTPQADTKPDLKARMEALVRTVADETSLASWLDHTVEARAIVALLPEPVDPDLIEARKLACENSRWDRDSEQWQNVMAGKQDHIPMVRTALAAIKRGRALALAGEKEA